jgi:glycosyltransferase involved in cell wall biosynthesis
MGFVPSYYLCINPLVIEQSMDEIYNIPTQRFLPANHIRFVERPQDIIFFKSTEVRLFSTDIQQEVSEGYTVTYAALQFAYYMGFSQVILIGVDHSFQVDGWPNSEAVSEGNDPNHFDPNYFGRGVRWQLPDLQNSEKSYELAKRVFEADGRVILDGTVDGHLTVFPKIDYRDVFESQRRIDERVMSSALPKPAQLVSLRNQPRKPARNFRVSAIVSTYNSERYLAGCLADLEAQSIASEIDIIVVDSGSQQNEQAIVRDFQRQYDNIQYVRTDHRETLYSAWNRAIALSRGTYVTNANTDDRHESYALERLAMSLDARPDCVLAYANQNIVEGEGTARAISRVTECGEFSRRRLFETCFIGSQPMWRKSVHDEFGGFDEAFFAAGDYEYWLRISQTHPFRYVNEVLGEHRSRADSLTNENQQRDLDFEVGTLLKCHRYANLYGFRVDEGGLSGSPVFSDWCEVNVLKRKTSRKLQPGHVDDIAFVRDWRRDQPRPILSIIIATFENEDGLLVNLSQLNLQSRKGFEVIIVNNGPELARFASKPTNLSYDLCYIQLKANLGPSLGRNVGAVQARSDLIAILDDDCSADSAWVDNIVRHFREGNIVALRGRVLPRSTSTYMYRPPGYDLGDESRFCHAGTEMNSAYRRLEFLEQTGFDEQLWFFEGLELSYRMWRAQGSRLDCIMYYPDVVIYHDLSDDPNHLYEARLRMRENWRILAKQRDDLQAYLQFHGRMLPQNSRPNDFAWLMYVATFCASDNLDWAVQYAWRAARVSPSSFEPYQVLGSVFFRQGRIEDSLRAFETVLGLAQPEPPVDGSRKAANTAIRKRQYIDAVLKLSYLYLRSGAKEEAMETLRLLEDGQEDEALASEAAVRRDQILYLAQVSTS